MALNRLVLSHICFVRRRTKDFPLHRFGQARKAVVKNQAWGRAGRGLAGCGWTGCGWLAVGGLGAGGWVRADWVQIT